MKWSLLLVAAVAILPMLASLTPTTRPANETGPTFPIEFPFDRAP